MGRSIDDLREEAREVWVRNFWLLLIFVTLVFPLVIYRGLVIAHLWAWFVAPTFGLATFGPVVGAGITIMVAFLTKKASRSSDEPGPGELLRDVSWSFFIAVVVHGVGWLLSRWV